MQRLLMTMAVRPNVDGKVAIRDPDIRMAQYSESISRWSSFARRSGYEMIVTETTGASLAEIRAGVGQQALKGAYLAQYEPSTEQLTRGKGAVEFAAVADAVRRSGASTHDTVHKVTGRLFLANPAWVLDEVPKSTVRARVHLNRGFVDTRCVSARADFWSFWGDHMSSLVDDPQGIYAEHALASVLGSEVPLGRLSIERFRRPPLFLGTSGSDGIRYDSRLARLRSATMFTVEALLERIATKKAV